MTNKLEGISTDGSPSGEAWLEFIRARLRNLNKFNRELVPAKRDFKKTKVKAQAIYDKAIGKELQRYKELEMDMKGLLNSHSLQYYKTRWYLQLIMDGVECAEDEDMTPKQYERIARRIRAKIAKHGLDINQLLAKLKQLNQTEDEYIKVSIAPGRILEDKIEKLWRKLDKAQVEATKRFEERMQEPLRILREKDAAIAKEVEINV